MLQKTIKMVLIVLLMLIIQWGIIFVINIVRCLNYQEPIFYWRLLTDEYSATYECLGYNVELYIYSNGVGKTRMNFFHTKLFETEILEDKITYYEDEKGIKRWY